MQLVADGSIIEQGLGSSFTIPPPADEVGEPQAFRGDGLLVDQAMFGVRNDLDVVVHRVSQHDVGLGSVRREDEVLRRPLNPAPSVVGVNVAAQISKVGLRDLDLSVQPTGKCHELRKRPGMDVAVDEGSLGVGLGRVAGVVGPRELEFLGEHQFQVGPGEGVDSASSMAARSVRVDTFAGPDSGLTSELHGEEPVLEEAHPTSLTVPDPHAWQDSACDALALSFEPCDRVW